ncbi:hypothetical protein HPP92_028763 [Vanilla planifolia]|uniref:Uncharacterized protein n=1 Tax=Vanilla planifolia TaxID=51239 RepID=A0A835P674_VANPL|nr:hypothetical protein HPP92_028763 [Vanilla planifolia]KAG0446608.1 hypothetical protein HPP92_028749 [Vanilla planifolia]
MYAGVLPEGKMSLDLRLGLGWDRWCPGIAGRSSARRPAEIGPQLQGPGDLREASALWYNRLRQVFNLWGAGYSLDSAAGATMVVLNPSARDSAVITSHANCVYCESGVDISKNFRDRVDNPISDIYVFFSIPALIYCGSAGFESAVIFDALLDVVNKRQIEHYCTSHGCFE